MTEEEYTRARESLHKALEENGAQATQTPDVLKRKLAYPIAKQTVAYAGKILFSAQPHVIPAITVSLRHEEGLLRFAVFKKEELPVFSARRGEERFAHNEDAQNERKESSENSAPANYNYDRTQGQEEMPRKDHDKITIDDIDRKLDEIMKNIK